MSDLSIKLKTLKTATFSAKDPASLDGAIDTFLRKGGLAETEALLVAAHFTVTGSPSAPLFGAMLIYTT